MKAQVLQKHKQGQNDPPKAQRARNRSGTQTAIAVNIDSGERILNATEEVIFQVTGQRSKLQIWCKAFLRHGLLDKPFAPFDRNVSQAPIYDLRAAFGVAIFCVGYLKTHFKNALSASVSCVGYPIDKRRSF